MREAGRERRRGARWRRPLGLAVGGAVVLSLAGGGVAVAMAARGADRYTTATVSVGRVEQTVAATGTVASVTRRDVSFPVAGTVSSVAVAIGDLVTAGQVLAGLDRTALQDALDQANDTLQQAQQRLSDDLDSQTSTTSDESSFSSGSSSSSSSSDSGSSSGSGPSPTPTASPDPSPTPSPDEPSGSSPGTSAAVAAVAAAQQALLARYDESRTAIATSSQALVDAQAACADISTLDPSTVTPTPTPTADAASEEVGAIPLTPSDAAEGEGGGEPESSGSDDAGGSQHTVGDVQALIASCQDALDGASAAQSQTAAAQQAVSDAATALDEAVAALQRALSAAPSGTPTDEPSAQPTDEPSSPVATEPTRDASVDASTQQPDSDATERAASSALDGGTDGSGGIASAADILADRAAIDAAQAQADIAARELTLVDLTSPIAGTVAAVTIVAGDQVGASSTTAVITVLGGDGYVVDLTVPLGSIDAVHVGQDATVTVPSVAAPLRGTVSSIGILDVSETSTPEYAVTVAVDAGSERLFDGSAAQVSIAVAGTGDVLTVPTSAVHIDGSAASVQVLEGGTVTDVPVERGAVGAELTEIASGLTEGQTVVLADRAQPIDSSSTSSSGLSGLTSSGAGGDVAFPGGAAFPGGVVVGTRPAGASG